MAVMGTPRNFDVPARRVIFALYPDIDVSNANNPAFVDAQRASCRAPVRARHRRSPARHQGRQVGAGPEGLAGGSGHRSAAALAGGVGKVGAGG